MARKRRIRDIVRRRRPRYALRYVGYLVQKGITVPTVALLVCVFYAATALTVCLGLATVCGFVALLGNYTLLHLLSMAGLMVLFGAAIVGCFGLYHLADYALVQAPGHFLNPLPPEKGLHLPDASILVRASASDAALQRNVLLRSSVKSVEDAPEMLLRAASVETTD